MIRSKIYQKVFLLSIVLVGNANGFSVPSRLAVDAVVVGGGRQNLFNDDDGVKRNKARQLNSISTSSSVHGGRGHTNNSRSRSTALHLNPNYYVNPPHQWFLPIGVTQPPLPLPNLNLLWMASFIPSCLGFLRTGYTVSYGYGGAMAASGIIQLLAMLKLGYASSGETVNAIAHASLYICYGIRLCLFLLYRQIKLPEVVPMTKREASILERMKRLPLVLGCATLFYFMSGVPFRIMGYCVGMEVIRPAWDRPTWQLRSRKTLLIGAFGFALAAFSDWYKCRMKAKEGKEKLVTTGPFRFLRHPNYTGEMIGWTACCVLVPFMEIARMLTSNGRLLKFDSAVKNGKAVMTKVADYVNPFSIEYHGNVFRALTPWMAVATIGWWGMTYFVLANEATEGSEKKQKEKYGGTEEYEKWIKSSWSGPRKIQPRPNTVQKSKEWEKDAIRFEKFKLREQKENKAEFEKWTEKGIGKLLFGKADPKNKKKKMAKKNEKKKKGSTASTSTFEDDLFLAAKAIRDNDTRSVTTSSTEQFVQQLEAADKIKQSLKKIETEGAPYFFAETDKAPLENDVCIPYDAAAKLAYESSDKSAPFEEFKMQYEADAVAEVIAKRGKNQ